MKRTPELDDRICDRIAKGDTLRQICRDEHISHVTVANWRAKDEAFDRRVKEARDAGFDAIAESCISIADATDEYTSRDSVEGKVRDPQRDKLRVWARLQLLAKWDPKRYGDAMTLRGDTANPLAVISDEALLQRIQANAIKAGIKVGAEPK